MGDLVLKQVIQHTTVGTRHALECKYTGLYEIISIESSSVTLDSPSAKFATPVKCHVDQLKPFVLPDSPSTSPAWDQGLRHQINVPLSPISSRTRKRSHPTENSDKQTEPPSKAVTRSATAKRDQKALQPTNTATGGVTTSSDKIQTTGPETKGQEVSAAPSRATSPFRAEASSLNRPKLGRMGKHLQRTTTQHAVQATDQASSTYSAVPMNIDSESAHQDKRCLLYTSPSPRDS